MKHKIILFMSLIILAGFVLPDISVATPDRRIALIIGNAEYAGGAGLKNPVNDARAIKNALEKLDFTVIKYENCTQKDIKKAIDRFGKKLKQKQYDVGLFFYAGHGVQVKGNNYLIPVDASLQNENDVDYDCVKVGRVLAKMESAGTKTNIIILDACRDNPFERSWNRGSNGHGLAFMNAPAGSLIAYATSPGKTASDGTGKHGRYTSALLKHIDSPGITILEMFQKVRSTVMKVSDKKQVPWESTSLSGNFYFASASGVIIDEPVKADKKSGLSVKANVSGADVFVDGKRIGATNLNNIKISSGKHRVRVEKDGYKPYSRTIHIKKRRSLSLAIYFEPETAPKSSLYVDARPSGARIRILNINPVFYQGIELDAGKYHLEMSSDGYETKRKWIELEPGEDRNINIRLKPVAAAQQKNRFTNSIGQVFMYIKPGTFMMGSPSGESGRYDDEKQHKVTLTRGFYMQTTEVTQGQWKAVMGNNPSRFKKGDNYPVEWVSWNDAQKFIRKLNQKEGTDKYRLPTEAEWEYACRAGTAIPFSFGRCLSTDQANYDGNYPLDGCSKGKYREKTVSVASFSPNAWGLYDMHGNVSEWCRDWFHPYPSGSVDPTGHSTGSSRVNRGGSWSRYARDCRSANRGSLSQSYRDYTLGFRLSRTF